MPLATASIRHSSASRSNSTRPESVLWTWKDGMSLWISSKLLKVMGYWFRFEPQSGLTTRNLSCRLFGYSNFLKSLIELRNRSGVREKRTLGDRNLFLSTKFIESIFWKPQTSATGGRCNGRTGVAVVRAQVVLRRHRERAGTEWIGAASGRWGTVGKDCLGSAPEEKFEKIRGDPNQKFVQKIECGLFTFQ